MFYSKTFYELYYIKWSDISYNRRSLISFMRIYKLYKYLSIFTPIKKRYIQLNKILTIYNKTKLELLYKGDEVAVRTSLIEQFARQGSIEILINGKFSEKTYKTISNLPLRDFDLILKRTNELVYMGKSHTIQDYSYTNTVIE